MGQDTIIPQGHPFKWLGRLEAVAAAVRAGAPIVVDFAVLATRAGRPRGRARAHEPAPPRPTEQIQSSSEASSASSLATFSTYYSDATM
ncbi:hypothetical protein EVAR_13149_1 [Eumeta japonica]|uniref:Uncharacterized protein n=1 Tax=Eumeta variegata TaxID=151549 RepID=A0A4C1U9Z2_EUMVA|nr:hypothetical protein EVAR_13149_1 [Eumeta japonica]